FRANDSSVSCCDARGLHERPPDSCGSPPHQDRHRHRASQDLRISSSYPWVSPFVRSLAFSVNLKHEDNMNFRLLSSNATNITKERTPLNSTQHGPLLTLSMSPQVVHLASPQSLSAGILSGLLTSSPTFPAHKEPTINGQ